MIRVNKWIIQVELSFNLLISTFGKRRKVALARLTDPRQTAIEWNGTKRLRCKSDIAVKLRTALSNWGAGWQVCIWGATKDIGCRVTASTSSTAAIRVKKVSMCNIYSQGRTNFVSKRLNNLQYFLTEDIRVDIRVSLSCREGSRTPICICVEIDFRSVMIFEGCCCFSWLPNSTIVELVVVTPVERRTFV